MSSKIEIEWSRIVFGDRTDGGYIVHGLGKVLVSDDTVRKAEEAGGNPLVELVEITSGFRSMGRTYQCGFMTPRSNLAVLVARKENQRLAVLQKIYETQQPGSYTPVGVLAFAGELGIPKSELIDIYAYLENKGLISSIGAQWMAVITSEGIDEVEHQAKYPGAATQHFGTNVSNVHNTNNISNSTVGAAQAGNNNTAYVSQTQGAEIAQLLQFVQQIRTQVQELPDEEKADASDALDAIEEEIQKPTPHVSIIKRHSEFLQTIVKDAGAVIGLIKLAMTAFGS